MQKPLQSKQEMFQWASQFSLQKAMEALQDKDWARAESFLIVANTAIKCMKELEI